LRSLRASLQGGIAALQESGNQRDSWLPVLHVGRTQFAK
jgi:hypothetical protein